MADPSRAQQRRILSSGERPSDRTWYNTALSNLAAGLPTDFASIAEAPEYIKSAAVGAWNAMDPKKDFGPEFMKSMYGDEGVAEIGQFVQSRMNEYLSELPPELANDPQTQKDIEAAILGSEDYYNLSNKHRSGLSQWSENRQNEIQSEYGLPPVWQQSTVDELTQMVPGLLIPTPSKIANVGRIANRAGRYAYNVAEAFLPGVTGPGSAVANAVVGTAVPQGIRYAGDMPSVVTGDALTTDAGVTFNTGIGEDASAPVPFPVAGATSNVDLGFQYKPLAQQGVMTSRGVPIDPERDPDGGGGGWGWSTVAGLGAGIVAAGALLRGRMPAGIRQQVIQDVDSPTAAQRLTDTNAPLDKSLTGFGATLEKTLSKDVPIRQVATRALKGDPLKQDKLNKLNRETGNASRMEIGNATTRTIVNGELPLLNRRTVPIAEMRKFHDTELDDAQKQLGHRAYILSNHLDEFELVTRTKAQEIADEYNKLARVRDPARRATELSRIRLMEMQNNARNAPTAIVADNITMAEVRRDIAAAQADPKISRLLTGARRVADDLGEVHIAAGELSRQDFMDQRAARPHYVPMIHNEYAKYGKGVRNVAERVKGAFRGRGENLETSQADKGRMYQGHRTPTRTNKGSIREPTTEMSNIFDALENAVFETHRQLRLNRAAQTFTEMVHGTSDWGHSIRQLHAPMPIRDFEGSGPHRELLKRNNVYTYNAGGMMHIIEAADSELARAMLHNPSSTMGVADAFRRLMQSTFTSNALAPWFAWRGAEYELGVVRVTLPSKYSKGVLDGFLKRTFPNTKLSRTFDFVPDPTIRLQQIAAVGHMISGKALTAVAEHLADGMMLHSTLVRALGPTRAQGIAQAGIRMANDMRTKYQFMQDHGILNLQQIVEHNESIFKDFDAAHRMLNAPGAKQLATGGKALFDGVTGIVDAVRNSVKYAVAAQNLEMLRQKHNGAIPNDVARQFIKDMKYMSGDMTRAIGNRRLAQTASFVPYGQNALNSTLHMVDGIRKNKVYVPTRILTNMVLPKLAMVTMLTQWMQDDDPNGPNEFSTHYWDNMPSWQRMSSVPMLSPTYLMSILTGEYRKPTINDVLFMAQAPEAIPFAETALAMFQAGGLFGPHAKDKQSYKDVLAAAFSFMNVNAPIGEGLNALINGSEKDISTGLSGDSETVSRIKEAFNVMFGGAVDVVGAAFTAGGDAWDRDSNIAEVFDKAFTHAAETAYQKFPETPLSPLFGGQRRHYTRTQVRERNMGTFDKIEDVSKQMSIQKSDIKSGSARGGLARPSTEDPTATALMQEMHSYANSGIMLSLRKQRSELYAQIERYDANRGQVSPSDYTRETERIKMAINDIDRQEEEVFDRLNTRLGGHYRQYGVTDVDSAIAYVKQTMHP